MLTLAVGCLMAPLAACGGGGDTALATPTETAVPGHPLSERSGNEQIDRFLDALISGDRAALARMLALVDMPCTSEQMLGGPPACQTGVAPGTMVGAFPMGQGCEGSFIDAATAERVVAEVPAGARIFAAYAQPPAAGDTLKFEFPRGALVVVLTYPSGSSQHPVASRTIHITDGRIVTVSGWCLQSPSDRVAGVAASAFLVPPP